MQTRLQSCTCPSFRDITSLTFYAASKNKVTQNVRRILGSQKTFANHLADEEASLSSQDQSTPAVAPPRASTSRPTKMASHKRSSAGRASTTPTEASQTDPAEASATNILEGASFSTVQASNDDDPLLKTYVPAVPSDAVMEALLSGPALSYNAARAASSVGKPQRHFCEICGYWGTIKCLKCGARVCGLECRNTHGDGRCIFYA